MPISIIFHLHHHSSSAPAAYGSFITFRAVGYLSQAHFSPLPEMLCPHPPTLLKNALQHSYLSISYYYISLYWLNTLILSFSHLTISVNALLICVYSLLLSDVNSEPNLLIRSSCSYLTPTHLSFGPYFLIFISLPPIY